MSTAYTNVNGYLIPLFALPTGSTPPLGKYGAMRARFLDEHRPFEATKCCWTVRWHSTLPASTARRTIRSVRWCAGLQNSVASPRI